MPSQSIQDLLANYQVEDKTTQYISQEFQDYAYRLACDLSGPNDRETINMCMRIVKTKPRGLVESAHRFIKDADHARNKVALFLWRLKQLEQEARDKNKKDEAPPGQVQNLFE